MITISGIKKTYQMGDVAVPALRGVSLSIGPGEFVAIMGPSGSGKSTLMHILGLLDVPEAGSYKLLGKEVSKLSEDELAGLRGSVIGFVFQQFNLLSRTSALENVSLPLLYAGSGKDHSRPEKVLKDVGLGGRLSHKPNELSGGQQQRVAVARALINQPSIIFADEPTGNLDSKSGQEIMELLERLNESGITVVLVTHDPEIAKRARRVITMRDGVVQSDEVLAEGGSAGKVAAKTRAGLPPVAAGAVSSALSLKESAEHFRQATRALLANKVRSGLSMLGILIGVAAVIAMLALGAGARESIEKQLSSLGSNLLSLRAGSRRSHGVSMEAGSVTRLSLDDARAIAEGVPSVRRVSASVSGRGQIVYGNKNWSSSIEGVMQDYAPMRAAAPVIGRFFTEEENIQRARVAVVGMTLVRELFGGENPVGETIKINRISFQVIGVLPEKGAQMWRDQDDIVIIPVATAMRRVLGKKYVSGIDIEASSAEAMAEAEAGVRELIVRRHRIPPEKEEAAFQIRNMAEIQEALTSTSKTMATLLASIAAISLLVGGIGIMNIMLVSVTERTREIGLRKAVGAKRRDILAQFLIEAVVISLAGGLIGVALGWLITWGMSNLAGWTATVSPWAVLMSVVFSAGVGIVFGLWPARKASLLHPIDALRYE